MASSSLWFRRRAYLPLSTSIHSSPADIRNRGIAMLTLAYVAHFVCRPDLIRGLVGMANRGELPRSAARGRGASVAAGQRRAASTLEVSALRVSQMLISLGKFDTVNNG